MSDTAIFRSHVQKRVDARGKVTGSTLYPGDVTPDNLLHAKVLFSGQPHARMLSIDLSAAEAAPGVITILTAADVPCNEYGLIFHDQPVFVGLGSSKAHADVSLWEGDQVAVVVAETEEAAALGASLIKIEWEQLPAVTSVEEAMKDELVLQPWVGSNILKHLKIRKGDMAAGWAAADVVVEGTYRLPYQEHAYLQPEAGVGYIDDSGRITVEIGGQWAHEDQKQVAHALGVPADQVRIIYRAVGGAFGGREDMSLQIVLALAAKKLWAMGIERPVRIIWSRKESIIGHHKRHEATIWAKWGATRDGKLTAIEARVITNSGAYAYTSTKVLGNAHFAIAGPYEWPNAHIDSMTVTTNTVPGGAFRGFGGPQSAFAAENQMNKLAEALGMDPVELRLKNCLHDGSVLTTQAVITPGVTITEVIQECAKEGGWGKGLPSPNGDARSPFQSLPADPSRIRRGRGFACALKNVGYSFGAPEKCEAVIELHGGKEIERVVLRHAGADTGQGAHTVFRQMAAAAVGVPLEKVELDMSDTATSFSSGSNSASRLTFMAGNSIREAAAQALALWTDEDRPAIGHGIYKPPATFPYEEHTGVTANPNITYGYAAEIVDLSVDIDTGHIAIERVLVSNDVGKAVNVHLIEGQIEGGIVQALGYTLMEDLQLKDGKIVNPYFSQYLIPGIKDIPARVDSHILEFSDPYGPWGVRGMGEMMYLPLAPAVISALHDATGVWFDEIPLLPWKVVEGLKK